MIANGLVWFDGKGKVRTLRVRTPAADRALKGAQEADWARLYPAARGYSALEVDCTAAKHRRHIRVERFADSFRSFAWKRSAPLAEKPELMIVGGTLDIQGSIGDRVFTFENAGYRYVIDASSVSVAKDGKQLSRERCLPIRR